MDSEPTVLLLDTLNNIIDDINSSPVLIELFGENVVKNLVIFPLGDTFKFAEGGKVKLTPEQKKTFVNELSTIIKKYGG